MIDRRRTAHIVLTIRPGESPEHVPAHLDVLAGAARPSATSTADWLTARSRTKEERFGQPPSSTPGTGSVP